MTEKRRARIIIVAWGEAYVMDLLSVTLPALLSPGNLLAVVSSFDCELTIVTETRFFEAIKASSVHSRLAAQCPVRLVRLDDLIGGRSYGMSLTFALHRGFEDLSEKILDYYLFFLNADFVLAEGSYGAVIERIDAGERLIFAPSYCVVAETVTPKLLKRVNESDGALAIPKREMAALALLDLHDTVKAKTVNRPVIRPDVFDQFYWLADDQTLLGYQMPVSLVCMQPERVYLEPVCFWDYGAISEACPTARRYVLGDSDDFLMIEIRGAATYREELSIGRAAADDIARVLSDFVTSDQIELGTFPLTLHAGPLPEGVEAARAQLNEFRSQVFSLLPKKPTAHREHPYWMRHIDTFRAQARELRDDEVQYDVTTAQRPLSALLRYFYGMIFGSIPHVTPLHPYWATLHHFVAALYNSGDPSSQRGLWIQSGADSIGPFRSVMPETWSKLSAFSAFKYGVPRSEQGFSLCVCELSWDDFCRFGQLYEALRPSLKSGARVLIFLQTMDVRFLAAKDVHLFSATLPWRDRATLQFSGSRLAAQAADGFRTMVSRVHDAGRWRLPLLAMAIFLMLPRTLVASMLECFGAADRVGRTRTSVTIEIEII